MGKGGIRVITKWGAFVGQEAEKNMGAVTVHGSGSGGSSGTLLSSGLLIPLILPEDLLQEVTSHGLGITPAPRSLSHQKGLASQE